MKKSVGFTLLKKVIFLLVILFAAKGFSATYYLSYPSTSVGWNSSPELENDSFLIPMIILGIVFTLFYIKKRIRE